jgi:hypothetical protein
MQKVQKNLKKGQCFSRFYPSFFTEFLNMHQFVGDFELIIHCGIGYLVLSEIMKREWHPQNKKAVSLYL